LAIFTCNFCTSAAETEMLRYVYALGHTIHKGYVTLNYEQQNNEHYKSCQRHAKKKDLHPLSEDVRKPER